MKTSYGIIIPEDWCEKLAELQKSDPDAIIAGGAIRDLYYGFKAKDVDYFTSGDMPDWPLKSDKSDMDYEGMQYVEGVCDYIGDPPINVVLIQPVAPIKLLESFDFGFCQIGFDGKQIIKTLAFNWDFKYGVITLHKIERYPRSIRRYARWLDRYNQDIVIPQLTSKVAL